MSVTGLPNYAESYRITGSLQHKKVRSTPLQIMKIHEYQAKAILSKYGVAIPRGEMAATRDEAETAAKKLLDQGAKGVVVKAQIHAGGRGKGGGVKVAKNLDQATEYISKILGMQ